MSRARRPDHRAAPLLAALALATSACIADDPVAPLSPECTTASDCTQPPGPCGWNSCEKGRCTLAPRPAGTPVGDSSAGDCQQDVCDGHGGVTKGANDADLPRDANACTQDVCTNGVPSHPAVPDRTACGLDGGSLCAAGSCVQCLVASDCGADDECKTFACTGGICSVTFVPYGTALASQTPGDCKEAICDGTGGAMTRALASDVPADDGSSCTTETCSGDVPSHPAVADGTACTSGPADPIGGAVCNAGRCAQCVVASGCPGVDTECQHRTCTSGACGIAYTAQGTPVASQTPGDCRQDVCSGAGTIVSVPLASDLPPDDGNACTDRVCTNGVPSSPLSAAGKACVQDGGKVCDGNGACVECNVGSDCASLVCASHLCQAPTCSDSAKNAAETDVDCGGGTCPVCADGKACLAAKDCASGVCSYASHLCAAPSCTDRVKNGAETDVDCGGGTCARCLAGKACTAGTDCQSGSCKNGFCGGVLLGGSIPSDGATDVVPGTAITIQARAGSGIDSSSVTAQTADGPCTGSVQLSADGFTTCVGFSTKLMGPYSSYNPYNYLWAVLEPAAPLANGTTYRLRTTTSLTPMGGEYFEPLEATFTTAGGAACDGSLVVSQVFPGGGLGGTYARDFVEVHNNGTVPVRLDGLTVQYTSTNGSIWLATPLSGTLPAGGYVLVQEGGGASGGAALPAPDATGTIDLSDVGGKVALVSTTGALYSTCSTGVLDLVGYGGTTEYPTSCFEGSGPAPAPADAFAAVVRLGGGCGHGNGNSKDFVSQVAVPHGSASPPAVCGCNGIAMNGTGLSGEMDACSMEPLGSTSAVAGQTAGPVRATVYEPGLTDPAGAPPLLGDLGYGPPATDPRWAAGWSFVPATWSRQLNMYDEFTASFTVPAAGGWAYVYRFGSDGTHWTYCDPNGAGSASATPFEPNLLPALEVTP